MRVFVTGATGFVGSAVVRDLIDNGHKVVGMARSDAGAEALRSAGAAIHRGDLEQPESLTRGAAEADAVIHTAFNHDFSNFAANCAVERRAIEALGDALKGSNRPLVITSGTGLLPPGKMVTEADDYPADSPNPRIATERGVADLVQAGVNVSVVRLPPSVHGKGDHGFVPLLIGFARDKGKSAYIGEGQNRWPAVHRLDAAGVFRRAAERAEPGARYHAVGEDGIAFRKIAEVIGKRLDVPVASIAKEDTAAHFGWFAHFAAIDNHASSAMTREVLGWTPRHIGLLDDLDSDYYFAS